VAVGGRGTLYGAIAGALLVNYAKTRFTAVFPEAWLFALGALFVSVTIFLPKGLMGLFKGRKLFSSEGLPWLKGRRKGEETQ
jgi:urea transport system permease protein